MRAIRIIPLLCAKDLRELSRDKRTLLIITLTTALGCILATLYLLQLLNGGQLSPTWLEAQRSAVIDMLHPAAAALILLLIYNYGLDITVGEKERGTIETTLAIPAPRTYVVVGKACALCAIAIVGVLLVVLLTVMISVIYYSTLYSLQQRRFLLLAVALSSRPDYYFLYILNCVVLLAPLVVLVGLHSRSTKEAYSILSLCGGFLYALVCVPHSLYTMVIPNWYLICLIPLANIGFLQEAAHTGQVHAALLFLSCTVNFSLATLLLFAARRALCADEMMRRC
jgi:sodium transport system permease protein